MGGAGRRAARAHCEFALNADDPLIADLGRDRRAAPRPGVTYFGIEDPSQALPELQHAHDAKHCRRCGAPVRLRPRLRRPPRATTRCPNCGADRPAARRRRHQDRAARDLGLERPRHTPRASSTSSSPSPASTTSTTLSRRSPRGCARASPLEQIREGLESMRAVFGRVETIEVSGKPVSILLIKNPAGANEVLRTLQLESDATAAIDLWLALNDRIADGRDVSWIWDADFELLADGVRRVICAGTRAPEMALRLKYAGWPPGRDRGDRARSSTRSTRRSAAAAGRLFALPTYTALLELRTLLADRGLAPDLLAMSAPQRLAHLAGGRVRRLRRRPAVLGRAGRGCRRPGARARCGSRPCRPSPGRGAATT